MKKTTIVFVLCIMSLLAIAQNREITGVVTDQKDGTTLPGVSVKVKGTDIGSVTDQNGKYNVSVPQGRNVLVFSFIGYADQEVPIGASNNIDVILKEDAVGLQEVVVTAMGIKRSKKSLSYAVSSLGGDETAQKSEPDVLKTLQGKVAGVNIAASDGTPGSATRITMRGNSSFLGNNQPLIIVDGIPYSNDQFNTADQSTSGAAYASGLATIDPNSIKNVEVLKGAAASALYGSRASNGVIIITTKSGDVNVSKKGLSVQVSSTIAMEEISNLPDYQNKYGTGTQFTYKPYNGSWGAPFSSLDSIPMWDNYSRAEFKDKLPDNVPYVPHPDNVKDLFDKGFVFDNSVTISGGTGKSSMSITLSDLQHDGYIPYSEYDKTSISLGGTTKVTDKLKAGGTFSYSKSTQHGPLLGYANAEDAGQASSMGRTLWLGRSWDTSLPYEDINGESVFFKNLDHPIWSWKRNGFTSNVDRIVAMVNAEYDIYDWMSARVIYGVNTYNDRRKQVTALSSVAYEGKGSLTEDHIWNQETDMNATLTVRKPISSDISLRAVAGINYNQNELKRTTVRGVGMTAKGIFQLTNMSTVVPISGADDFPPYSKKRLLGAYMDATVGFKNYLFLNLTGRNDWSSTLPENSRSYFYPSASLSFVVSDAFDLHNNILDLLKVRLSWAKVGNDADPYSLSNTYSINPSKDNNNSYETSFPFRGVSGTTASWVYADPDLTPEFTEEIEFGANIELFKSRISLDLTLYSRKTTDQIAPVDLPKESGFGAVYTNFGEMSNKGIELALNLTPVKLANSLRWDFTANYTKNVSKVESLEDNVERVFINSLFSDCQPVLQKGEAYGVFYGSRSARDENGNILIDPESGQMLMNTEHGIIGDPNPDYLLSLDNTIKYKGFSLRVFCTYKKGGDIYSNSMQSLLGRGVTKDTEDREKSYIIPGVYGDANTLKPYYDENGNTIRNTTQISMNDVYFNSGDFSSFGMNGAGEWSVFDGSVFRVNEISFGYEVPKKFLKKTPFGSASISFTGRNLWFFTPNMPKYANLDPEINAFGSDNTQGIEYASIPSTRRYGVNIKFSF